MEVTARSIDDALTRRLGGAARKRVILVLATVLALNGANSGAIGAMAVELERSLHIDNTGLGLLVTASSLAGAVVSIPIGVLADRFNRRWLLLFGLSIWTLSVATSAFAGSLTMLVLSQLAIGSAAATAGPTVASLTGDFFSADERGSIYGYILTGELVGAGFGIVVAGDLGAALGWRSGLFLLSLVGAGLTWLVYRNLPEPRRGGSERLLATMPGDAADSGGGATRFNDRSRCADSGRRSGWSGRRVCKDSSPPPTTTSHGIPSDSGSSPLPATSSGYAPTSS